MPNNPDMRTGATKHHRADIRLAPGTVMQPDLTMGLPPGAVQLAESSGLRDRIGQVSKRCLDLCLAIPVVLLVLPPLCMLVWIAQLLQSRGPLFYRQARCGQNGREFTILKFRTMNVPPPGQTDIEDDPRQRIYPLGVVLRRSKLDEIPQFVNVLLGSMSVVGPRPHHGKDCDKFSNRVEDYYLRLVAKPGITGLAQYSEYRGDFQWNCIESRVQKDVRYIREWSFTLDVQLIFKTVNIVTRRVIGRILRPLGLSISQPGDRRRRKALSLESASAVSQSDQTQDSSSRKAA